MQNPCRHVVSEFGLQKVRIRENNLSLSGTLKPVLTLHSGDLLLGTSNAHILASVGWEWGLRRGLQSAARSVLVAQHLPLVTLSSPCFL